MNKKMIFFIVIVYALFSENTFCQSERPKKHNHPSGKMNTVSLGAALPLGDFSSTHIIGAAAEYSWSNHRFGSMDVKPLKPFGFIANAGLTYYFGKKETISGYSYNYREYFFIYAYGGAIYNPCNKGNISVTAGPALGIYNGILQFNIGAKLEGSYYLTEKIAVSPAIIIMKESNVNALWAASLKATIAF